MPSTASNPDTVSALRVGLSAGKSLLGGLMLGIALALVLGCTSAAFYFLRLDGPGMPAAAHAGGAGAFITLLFSPSLVVALVLVFIIPAYVMVGLQIGRARATGKLVARYGQGLSQRLAEMLLDVLQGLGHGDLGFLHLPPMVGGAVVHEFQGNVAHKLSFGSSAARGSRRERSFYPAGQLSG